MSSQPLRRFARACTSPGSAPALRGGYRRRAASQSSHPRTAPQPPTKALKVDCPEVARRRGEHHSAAVLMRLADVPCIQFGSAMLAQCLGSIASILKRGLDKAYREDKATSLKQTPRA